MKEVDKGDSGQRSYSGGDCQGSRKYVSRRHGCSITGPFLTVLQT